MSISRCLVAFALLAVCWSTAVYCGDEVQPANGLTAELAEMATRLEDYIASTSRGRSEEEDLRLAEFAYRAYRAYHLAKSTITDKEPKKQVCRDMLMKQVCHDMLLEQLLLEELLLRKDLNSI